MKKRFTLMMMVICFLMSIPLKMMAEKVTVHYINEKGWADVYAYVYKAGAPIGDSWPGKKCTTFKTVSGNNVATWELDLGAEAASGARIIFNGGDGKPQTDGGGFPLINNITVLMEQLLILHKAAAVLVAQLAAPQPRSGIL